jgi:enamine deaminase RidA (YjgF/YER057c/UK114 family)
MTTRDRPKQVTMRNGPRRAVGLSLTLCAAMMALPGRMVSMQERRVVKDPSATGATASPVVVAGGFVFVSGVIAAGDAGKLDGTDVQAQTRQVLQQLQTSLDSAGSSLAQVVSMSVYLKHARDFQAMNDVYREFFADKAPTRTTVVTDVRDGALVEMSAMAVPNGAEREVLHPAGWMKSPRPYSYIVRAGGLVFLSGLVSRRGIDDQPVTGSVTVQVKTILDNAGTLLRTAGLTYTDVVAARVFLTDDTYFEAMNDQYRRYFSVAPPARATAVAELVGADSSVEITLIAADGEKHVLGPLVSPSLPLSSAVRTGKLVFLSGVLGDTTANATDVAAQTKEILGRISRTLESAGLSFADVVDNVVYLPDLWHRKSVDEIYGTMFPNDPPCRTIVGARLVARTGLIEMMMTAVAR